MAMVSVSMGSAPAWGDGAKVIPDRGGAGFIGGVRTAGRPAMALKPAVGRQGTKRRGQRHVHDPEAAPAAQIDATVLALLREGDAARAFEAVMDAYERRVYRLCYALLRDAAQAEDAAQETLIRVWKALDRFDGRAALSTWIYAIARNRCLTALSRRREQVSLSEPDVAARAEATAAVTDADADADAPEALLRELVDALPERYRRAITLFYYGDRSVAEVALQLGVPEGTVKTHLHRARAALHAQLEHIGIKDMSAWLQQTT
jgi:RNA polymerase sigma-70 factor (ECF subfamily)